MLQFVKRWLLPALVTLTFGLLAGAATAGEEWLVRGETKTVDGQIPIVFWADQKHTQYQKLPAGVKPETLLQGAQLAGVPPGWSVEPVQLEAKVEQRGKEQGGVVRSSASWDAYVLSGTWKVTVPRDCPEGEYHIRVTFPEVERYRDDVGALDVPTSIPLTIKVFATAAARRQEDLEYNSSGYFALAAIAAVGVVLLGGVIVWWKFFRS
jgi:hypothetical protein